MSVDLLKWLLEGLQQQSLFIINISNITWASFASSQQSWKKLEISRAFCWLRHIKRERHNYADSSKGKYFHKFLICFYRMSWGVKLILHHEINSSRWLQNDPGIYSKKGEREKFQIGLFRAHNFIATLFQASNSLEIN